MGIDLPEEDDLPRPDDTVRSATDRTSRLVVEERDRFEYFDALCTAVDDASQERWATAVDRFKHSWAEHCDRWPQAACTSPDRSADPPGSWRGDSGRYLDTAANREIEERCARIADVERTAITPAMREIESQDPERHLAGLDHRLKGPDRLKDKVAAILEEQPESTVGDAVDLVPDSLRYTFEYDDDRYTHDVTADIGRMKEHGFELIELRNTWDEDAYKGINTRWWSPGSETRVEVQFHTHTSLEAKQMTHAVYERSRNLLTDPAEVAEIRNLQRELVAHVEIPPGACGIPNYRRH